MFKNQFQGGSHLDVFVASGKDPKLKVANVEREFNRDVKGYVYTVSGSTTSAKFQFPLKDAKQSTLSLNQRYLVFQIFLPSSRDFAVEFSVTDVGNNKRRVHMSTSIRDASKSALHFKLPLANIIKRETWLNLCFDLISLASEIVPIQAYRSLDAFTLSGSFKLRRIFTMKCQPHDTCGDDLGPMMVGGCTNIPQNLQFNATLPTATQVVNLDRIKSSNKSTWLSSSRNPETSGYWSSSSEDLHASRTRLHSSRDQQQRQSTHIAFGTKVPIVQPRARNTASASSQHIVAGRKADSADIASARGGGGRKQQATSGRTPRGEQLLQTRSADPVRRGGGKRSVVPLPTAAISPPSVGGDERLLKMVDEMELKPRVFTFSAQPRSAPRHRSESTSTASTNDFSRSDDDEDLAGDETSSSRRVSRNTPSPSVAAAAPHRRFMMAMSKPLTSSQSPDIPPLLTTASTKYDSGKYDPAPPPPPTAGNKPPAQQHQHQATTSLLNRVSIRSSSATLTASVNTLVQNSTCLDPDDDQQEEDEEKEGDISSEPSQVSININRRSVREIEHQPTPTTASTPTSASQTPAARILESSNFQVGPWSDSLEEEMLLNMKREIENESHAAHDDDDQAQHGVERSKTDYQDNLEDSFDTSWSTYKNPPPMQPQAYDSEMRRNDPFTNTNHNLLTTTMMSSTMNDVQTINNTINTTTTNTSNPREWSEEMMMMSSPPPVLPSQRHHQRSSNVLQLELDSMGLSDGSSSIRSATDASDTDDDQMLDLMYDPCLNCYFDPKTGKYYELKN